MLWLLVPLFGNRTLRLVVKSMVGSPFFQQFLLQLSLVLFSTAPCRHLCCGSKAPVLPFSGPGPKRLSHHRPILPLPPPLFFFRGPSLIRAPALTPNRPSDVFTSLILPCFFLWRGFLFGSVFVLFWVFSLLLGAGQRPPFGCVTFSL